MVGSGSRLKGTLVLDGAECSYAATLSEAYKGTVTCPDRPAMPLTQMLLSGSRGGPVPGGVLAVEQARSLAAEAREAREAAASAPDPDERAAALVTRGYRPGAMSDLSRRLGDTLAESARVHSNGFSGARRATDFGMSAQVSVKDPDGRRPEDWDAAGGRHFRALPDPE